MPLKEVGQVSFLVERDAGWERIYFSLLGDVLGSWILDGAGKCLIATLDFGCHLRFRRQMTQPKPEMSVKRRTF
jgi:hypothetical protein